VYVREVVVAYVEELGSESGNPVGLRILRKIQRVGVRETRCGAESSNEIAEDDAGRRQALSRSNGNEAEIVQLLDNL
jgi:hypothetical protein